MFISYFYLYLSACQQTPNYSEEYNILAAKILKNPIEALWGKNTKKIDNKKKLLEILIKNEFSKYSNFVKS